MMQCCQLNWIWKASQLSRITTEKADSRTSAPQSAGSQRRGVSRRHHKPPRTPGPQVSNSMCNTLLPVFENPCFRPAGTTTSCPLVSVTCLSSIHTSACPSRTHNISSTACKWFGAPCPGSHHCSKRQSWVALFAAEAFMRVLTPVRHSSVGCRFTSTTRMGFSTNLLRKEVTLQCLASTANARLPCPQSASSFLINSGSRASGAVISAVSSARSEPIGHASCSRGKSRANRATSFLALFGVRPATP